MGAKWGDMGATWDGTKRIERSEVLVKRSEAKCREVKKEVKKEMKRRE